VRCHSRNNSPLHLDDEDGRASRFGLFEVAKAAVAHPSMPNLSGSAFAAPP
jgi:hypothetical protein